MNKNKEMAYMFVSFAHMWYLFHSDLLRRQKHISFVFDVYSPALLQKLNLQPFV